MATPPTWAAQSISGVHSHHFERSMRRSRQLHLDRDSCAQLAARADDPHHSCLSYDLTVRPTTDNRGQKTGVKVIQLHAWIPQPCNLDDHLRTEPKSGASREAEEVEATCGHVLAKIARFDREPTRTQLIVQLGVDQMHLAQIRLRRVPCDA